MGWLASFTGAMRPGRVRIMKHLGMSTKARTHTGIGLPPEHIGCGVYFEQILVLLRFTNTPIHDAGWYGVLLLLLLFLLTYRTYFFSLD
jgi:hypothetical protein